MERPGHAGRHCSTIPATDVGADSCAGGEMMDLVYTFPSWFADFMAFYAQPEKPSVKAALSQYAQSLPDPNRAPKYWQVRRVLKEYHDLMHGCADAGGAVMKQDALIRRLIEKAYLLGFNAAGEGWNGEYSFKDGSIDPELDQSWAEQRDRDLEAVLESVK